VHTNRTSTRQTQLNGKEGPATPGARTSSNQNLAWYLCETVKSGDSLGGQTGQKSPKAVVQGKDNTIIKQKRKRWEEPIMVGHKIVGDGGRSGNRKNIMGCRFQGGATSNDPQTNNLGVYQLKLGEGRGCCTRGARARRCKQTRKGA